MENNEIKIQVPPGMCIDEENSTFECIKFKPKEALTYDDIAKKLFCQKGVHFVGMAGNIISLEEVVHNYLDPNNAVSKEQCERLLAINKLMNVAYYFNEIVDKNVDNTHYRYVIEHDVWEGVYIVASLLQNKSGLVQFKTAKSAKKAIEILGEETIKLAISL